MDDSSRHPVNTGAATGRPARRRAAGRVSNRPVELGPSPFGHRALSEELLGLAELRAARSSRTPRPGAGTRAVTDPRAVITPRAYISPRVLVSPRAFIDPRGTTGIRAIGDRWP